MESRSNSVARSKDIKRFCSTVLSPRQQFEMRLAMYVVGPDEVIRHSTDRWREHRYNGIYMLFGESDELLYIGRAEDIGKRIYQHRWKAEIPAIAFSAIEVEDDSIGYACKALENFYIKALLPPYNGRLECYKIEELEFNRLRNLWKQKCDSGR